MVDPHSDTQYTCEILDGGEEPIVSFIQDTNRKKKINTLINSSNSMQMTILMNAGVVLLLLQYGPSSFEGK